ARFPRRTGGRTAYRVPHRARRMPATGRDRLATAGEMGSGRRERMGRGTIHMKIRTLIVDDEAPARARIRQLLKTESDFEIVGECANGRQAVAAIQKQRPDLVFLDVQMPRLGGFEVCAAIAGEAMPLVIFVTAYDHYALQAFEVHAMDYLLKPFDRERFQ